VKGDGGGVEGWRVEGWRMCRSENVLLSSRKDIMSCCADLLDARYWLTGLLVDDGSRPLVEDLWIVATESDVERWIDC
jgi:hypothetical protein